MNNKSLNFLLGVLYENKKRCLDVFYSEMKKALAG